MNEQNPTISVVEQQKGNEGITLRTFWDVFRRRIIWLVLAAVIGAGAMFGVSKVLIKPTYSSSAKFWIQIVSENGGASNNSYSSSYMQGAARLADDYAEIIQDNIFLEQYIVPMYNEKNGTNYTVAQIASHFTVTTSDKTTTFTVRTVDTDPEAAYALLQCFEEVIPQVFNDRETGFGVPTLAFRLINTGSKATAPSSPNVKRNVLLGAAGLVVLTYLVFFLIAVFDRTIYDEEDLKENFDLPVIGQIPQWLRPGESAKSVIREIKRISRGARDNKEFDARDYDKRLLGESTPFSITESFKTLRTNMMYADAKDRVCPVWGVTSAFTGAGKSIVIANVAESFAMLDKRVLLIDGDMHCPVQHKIFGESRHRNGLSEALVGIAKEPLRDCVVATKCEGLDLMVCGRIPPNASELLASERMRGLLAEARQHYDYIFIDLPPILETTDAGVLAPIVDEFFLVVRASVTGYDATRDALDYLSAVRANVVGFVLNGTDARGGKYYHRKYYSSYVVSAMTPETDVEGHDAETAKDA